MTLKELLNEAASHGASDLHITAGMRPLIRIDGELKPLAKHPIVTETMAETICFEPLTDDQVQTFKKTRELDFSIPLGEKNRVRGNLFLQKETVAGAFRLIPFEIPTPTALGLPPTLLNLIHKPHGLILVTGPTGSGKSTTLASLLNEINKSRALHIVTIEDPVEYMYQPQKCRVSQRQVGTDTHGFGDALKHVLRQDPDVILIGEMRDLDTIQSAITLAETGHLVLATLHTNTATQTIDRIIDVFPPHQQHQVRTQLSQILECILSQKLIPKIGGGRALAMEIMVPNYAIRNLIRENKVHQIYAQMQIGQQHTLMQTLSQSLGALVKSKVITPEEAMTHASQPDEVKSLIK